MKSLKTCSVAVFAAVVLFPMFASAQQEAAILSRATVHRMMRIAHTPAEYRALAVYFSSEQQKFQVKAADAKEEWTKRENMSSALAMKYPRPVDSARNRYEYFAYEASEMEQQAVHFQNLATNHN